MHEAKSNVSSYPCLPNSSISADSVSSPNPPNLVPAKKYEIKSKSRTGN